jgi:hypothetical protein
MKASTSFPALSIQAASLTSRNLTHYKISESQNLRVTAAEPLKRNPVSNPDIRVSIFHESVTMAWKPRTRARSAPFFALH